MVRSLSLSGDIIALGRNELDLTQYQQIKHIFKLYNPQIVVNTAAYTAVDRAESERDLCFKANAEGVGLLAEECKKINATLIHFSTDYIFDGLKNSAYVETDPVSPINVYGESKWQGEKNILAVGGRHYIYRVSWVYSHRGHNFVKTILRLAKERPELKIVADQKGTPTWARFIAEGVSLTIGHPGFYELGGIYHLVPHGETSWYDFAKKAIDRATSSGFLTSPPQIHPIITKEYPTPAQRPLNSRLNNQKFVNTFKIPLQHWEKYLELCITSL